MGVLLTDLRIVGIIEQDFNKSVAGTPMTKMALMNVIALMKTHTALILKLFNELDTILAPVSTPNILTIPAMVHPIVASTKTTKHEA